ncbi:MAG: thermonuclease family protein [Actinoallomurus sp.]
MRKWALAGAVTLAVICGAHVTGTTGDAGRRGKSGADGGVATREGGRASASDGDGRAAREGGRTPVGAVAAEPAGPPPEARSALVLRVVDGDTLLLRIDGRSRRVRLIGVDAPETWGRRDCFGGQASRALRRLTPVGSPVRVAGDREAYDRFGRRLLHLWTSRGRLVAAELVRTGLARTLVIPPNTRYAPALEAAEAQARRVGAGLWGACR